MHAIQATLANYPVEAVSPGTVLLRRAVKSGIVLFIESGRVAIGVADEGSDGLVHQLGLLQGPNWLEPTAAVLDLPSAVSAVAQTDVWLRRVPLADFHSHFTACAELAREMLFDVARAHRQQTDLAISRLAKDAGARCAEWLLRQAHTTVRGVQSVQLQQSKRDIAAQLGIAPETLSRVLSNLRASHLIGGSGRVVDLVDVRGLRSLAGV